MDEIPYRLSQRWEGREEASGMNGQEQWKRAIAGGYRSVAAASAAHDPSQMPETRG
jgi:hypothetical protein